MEGRKAECMSPHSRGDRMAAVLLQRGVERKEMRTGAATGRPLTHSGAPWLDVVQDAPLQCLEGVNP